MMEVWVCKTRGNQATDSGRKRASPIVQRQPFLSHGVQKAS